MQMPGQSVTRSTRSSNYNRVNRPATVMVTPEQAYVAVKRESLEDLVRNDV